MEVTTAIQKRISANKFDPSHHISESEINHLVKMAIEAPTSLNIQNYRFVAVTDPEAKAALQAASYNQQKVSDASVAFVLLGDLKPQVGGIEAWQKLLDDKRITEEMFNKTVKSIETVYASAEHSKNEAYRTLGMAGMNLMLAAEDMGYVSCPMGGFVADKVLEALNIPDRYFPVMLIVVGKPAADGNFPRKPRLGLDKVLAFNSGESFPA